MSVDRILRESSSGVESAEDLAPFLEAGPTVETGHPDVVAFCQQQGKDTSDPIDTAVRLYYAVRDGIRYDPYTSVLTVEGLRATTTLEAGRGWCVSKAILLAACCRSCGIPARLGFADVRNHLSTARMRERMKTDVFYWHGYTSIHLDGKWVKATPAFNIELCEKFRLLPLEFDGRGDSIYHPFDADGNRHMEYLQYRGELAEPPIAAMIETFRAEYGAIAEQADAADTELDFDREVEEETGG
jgi:transglutaminase-like putative cysteine protease